MSVEAASGAIAAGKHSACVRNLQTVLACPQEAFCFDRIISCSHTFLKQALLKVMGMAHDQTSPKLTYLFLLMTCLRSAVGIKETPKTVAVVEKLVFIPASACTQPRQAGPCEGLSPRWYFDSKSHQCRQFAYGGCLVRLLQLSRQVCANVKFGETKCLGH